MSDPTVPIVERLEILTTAELAAYLHVHQSTIYRLIKARRIPSFKVARDWRFNRADIDRWRLGQERTPRK